MPLSFASCEILSTARRGIGQATAYAERRIPVDETDTVFYRPRRHDHALSGFTLLPQSASPSFEDPHTQTVDAPRDLQRQAGATVLVDQRPDAQASPVMGLALHNVEAPDVIAMERPQPYAGAIVQPRPAAWSVLLGGP